MELRRKQYLSTLKEWRDSVPLSTRELANQAHISQPTIIRIENGQHKPRAATIRAILGVLNKYIKPKITVKDVRW
jgi:predicted transcriptional regulator